MYFFAFFGLNLDLIKNFEYEMVKNGEPPFQNMLAIDDPDQTLKITPFY